MNLFLEIFGPSVCAACTVFGGAQAGIDIKGVDIGIGWVDRHLKNGRMDDDTLIASASAVLARTGPWGVGVFAAETFQPDGKPSPGHGPLQIGPFGEAKLYGPISARLYVDVNHPTETVALRWTF